LKPAPFSYEAPSTLEEALALLAERGDEATVLAGGQSLVPMLNFRLVRPAVVVDVNRLPGLDAVEPLRLGALARTATVERSPATHPGLREALEFSGHPQIRNRSTVGGSLAHADPASELPAVVVALDGEVVLRSRAGERIVAASDFFLGPYTTARTREELVTEVRLAAAPARSAFREVARRHGDFALVGAYAALVDGRARVALCGASPAPVRAGRVEQALAQGASVADAARLAAEEVEPWDDVHGTADYRRALATVVVRRALEAVA
jgi:carbon-monoxide dehydrogenase medium subunit